MPDVDAVLLGSGGIAHLRQLTAAGISRDHVFRASTRGEIVRVRPGIYASHSASPEVVRAARVGGRLAGMSAARRHGLWALASSTLVVEVAGSSTRLRDPDDASKLLNRDTADVRVLCRAVTPSRRVAVQAFGLSSLEDTLGQVAISEAEEFAVATLDSALRRTPLSAVDLNFIAATVPASSRNVFSMADRRADSGTESVLRVLLTRAGFAPQIQVPVPFTDLDRMDLLIGDRLVVECDSERHHGGRDQRLRDLRRDAALACLGFVGLRFDYSQVFDEPLTVVAAVSRYVELGLHRSARD